MKNQKWKCHLVMVKENIVYLEYFKRNVVSCCMKCCICLATPLLNTIKQHATMCNKCCMMFYEMLYSNTPSYHH